MHGLHFSSALHSSIHYSWLLSHYFAETGQDKFTHESMYCQTTDDFCSLHTRLLEYIHIC